MAIPEASNLPIRYASAGPVIGNAEGGEAVPGVGFQLRMAEFTDSQGALTLSGTLQDVPTINGPGGTLVATLQNPKPNRRYRATCIVQLETTADLIQVIGGRFAWDVGSGFNGAGHNFGGKLGAAGVTAAAGQFQFEQILTLGSALPSPVLDASTFITVKAQLVAGAADVDVSNGMYCYIALTEHL